MSETETKAERKERKRLKKLKKEAKRAKKRKLQELEEGADEETPKSKKRKLSSDSDDAKEPNGHADLNGAAVPEVNFEEITKIIVKASKDQLQNALLQCAKQSPSSIPEMEKNLEATEIDADLTALLSSERDTAAAQLPQQQNNENFGYQAVGTDQGGDTATPTPGKVTGVVAKWNHAKGFGFITRDDGKGDLFAHCRQVWAQEPHNSARVGSRVEFEVTPGAEDKGDQASNVSAIGGGECPGGRQAKGTMSNWLADRGFGFIQMDDGGEDIFCADREVWDPRGYFETGERVEFDIKVKDDGRRSATFVTLVGGVVELCRNCEGVGYRTNECPICYPELAVPQGGQEEQGDQGGQGGY